ncbi:MAG: glutaminyl-peptide cyclotransferase [Bacteroidales bacterium]|nr:glutaminyl-peptide cyclotransferase [Bacteroidales bacterium]
MRRMLILLLFCLVPLAVCCRDGAPRRYGVEVVQSFPHETSAYTQGLFFHGGELFESTGQYGESSLRKVELESGTVLRRLKFGRKYFAEGSVVLDGKLYVLTWTNRLAFVYDAQSLDYLQAYSYPREGWGLTTDGRSLIASDGSSRLYFLSPEFRLEKSLNVTLDGRPLRLLNELEWIDGRIWANVYTTDLVVVINPESGKVEATVDCSGLLPPSLRTPETDVLNGIAYLPGEKGKEGRIFLTGKYWPRLYEIRLRALK